MSESKTRVVGSGWTQFSWQGQTLAWLSTIRDQAPQPVAQARPIQPLNAEHPVEFVTARALTHGTLTLGSFEQWDKAVWQELPGLRNSRNILEVFKNQVRLGNVSCRKIIKVPNGAPRVKVYHNCTISTIDESENIDLNTMESVKSWTVLYTHNTWV